MLSVDLRTSPQASLWLELARSGALDEISNAPGAVEEFIRGRGLVRERRVNRPLVFVVYQTGTLGPQNGFRLCLVHEGFDLERTEDMEVAASRIDQTTLAMVVLGESIMGQWS